MPLWIHCPQCDQHYQFPEEAAGKQAACPKCGRVLAVSAPAPAAMPVPPAPRLPQAVPQPVPMPRAEEPLWAVPVAGGRRPPVPDDRRQPRPRPMDYRRPAPAAPRILPSPETLDPSLPATAGDDPKIYHHPACGGGAAFTPDVAARLSGDPFGFTPAVYCAACRRYVGLRSVVWHGTRETLAAYRGRLRRQMHPGKILLRLLGGPLIGALLGAALGFLANPNARLLGLLAGLVIGLPLGWFVTGVVYQVGWAMGRRKKAAGAA